MSDYLKIHAHPFLQKDPHSKALLNINREKAQTTNNIKILSDKYIQMESRIENIDNSINDIKKLLQQIILEKNN